MTDAKLLKDLHWLMEILQTIDVGLMVIDDEFRINTWNAFMENHSGHRESSVKGRNLFDVFPELPQNWFRKKVDTVRQLNIRAFTTWEQRPYLVRFRTYHPITSVAEHMYQNSMLYPLLNAGGDVDYVAIVIFDVTDVATNKMALETANKELERLSREDGLTGLFNRKYWESVLNQELRRARRHNHPTTLIMADLDHFKAVNDEHGHTVGDDVLRATGKAVLDTVRTTDIAGRYGGEEIAILLPETREADAMVLAERLRTTMEQQVFETDQGPIQVTLSLGLAELCPDFSSVNEWIDAADKALYSSKENGRNRSTAASAMDPTPAGRSGR